MKKYYVYILSGSSYGPVFIEMTSDLSARMREHRLGRLSQKAFRIDQLVHIETFNDPYTADMRVKSLKSASRSWLDKIIERRNPEWRDLLSAPVMNTRRAA